MIKVIAKRYVAPGRYQEYLSMVSELIYLVRQEQGCISYELAADEQQSLCVMVETWQTAEDLAAHAELLKTSGWQERLNAFADPARPGGVEKYTVIE